MSSVKTLGPPLIVGDQLTIEEFLRRWSAMPGLEHAELVEGTVFMPSPLTMIHGKLQAGVIAWLMNYAAATPGCIGGCESTWVLSPNSAPQPDAYLVKSQKRSSN